MRIAEACSGEKTVGGKLPEVAVSVRSHFRRGGLAGADRPNRLVRKQNTRELVQRSTHPGRLRTGVSGRHACGATSRSCEAFADADDGREFGCERGFYFAVHGFVGFAEKLAALGMADDARRAAGIVIMRMEISPVKAPSRSQ